MLLFRFDHVVVYFSADLIAMLNAVVRIVSFGTTYMTICVHLKTIKSSI